MFNMLQAAKSEGCSACSGIIIAQYYVHVNTKITF